jgi:N-methylhydantoinase A
VADADLVLGYINPDNFLAGRLRLDAERAREAIRTRVAEPLGMTIEEAAEGIKTIVDARMADLIRTATIEQGNDPTDFVLYAYGGAGPSHAFSYGHELGVSEIVVPLTASVHSAFGVAASDLTVAEELSDPIISPPGTEDYAVAIDADELNARFATITQRAVGRLEQANVDAADVHVTRFVEMRFRFQIHVLSVSVPDGPFDADAVRALVRDFIDVYEARFGEGSAFEAAGVELTTFRVVASVPAAKPELQSLPADGAGAAQEGTRPVYAGGEWRDARILGQDAIRPGLELDGLAIIELADTTIVIGEGQHAAVDQYGNVVIGGRA